MAEVTKVILDVDTGVDDAQAIMMTLTCAHADLLAVTCVSGNTDVDQAMINTHRVLAQWGALNVPVYRGCQVALIGQSQDAAYYHGKDGMGDCPDAGPAGLVHPLKPEEHASNAIVRLVNEHPGEIVLVALAPLTNLALALHLDPDLGSKLRKLVIMGGNLDAIGNNPYYPCAEFNFSVDPEAACFVLNHMSGACIQLVTYKACQDCHMEWDFLKELMAVPTAKGRFHASIFEAAAAKKFKAYTCFHTCDPTALMVALHPEVILDSAKVYVTVELNGAHTRGQLVVDWRGNLKKAPNVEAVKIVDSKRLQELLMAMVS